MAAAFSKPSLEVPRAENEAPHADVEPMEFTSEALLGGQRQIFIRHGTERYRLRLTRMNKLIK